MTETVEFYPPGYHHYPLPGGDLPHELFECGVTADNTFHICEHDIPSNEPFFELVPIPNLSSPVALQPTPPTKLRYDVDFPKTEALLARNGLGGESCERMSVAFTKSLPFGVAGDYEKYGTVEIDDQMYASKPHIRLLPGLPLRMMNASFRHELGHYFDDEMGQLESECNYYNKEKVAQLRKWAGVVTIGFSFATGALETVGHMESSSVLQRLGLMTLGGVFTALNGVTTPRSILWLMNKDERSAQRFAKRNRGTKLITTHKLR